MSMKNKVVGVKYLYARVKIHYHFEEYKYIIFVS